MKKVYILLLLVITLHSTQLYPMALAQKITWGSIKQYCKRHGTLFLISSAATLVFIAVARKVYIARQHVQQQQIVETQYKTKAAALDEQIKEIRTPLIEKSKRSTPEKTGGYHGWFVVPLQSKINQVNTLEMQVRTYEDNKDWDNALECKRQMLAILQPHQRKSI